VVLLGKSCELQQSEYLRQTYIEEASIYNPEMLIFFDETGVDRRNILRRHGRGKPLVNCLEDAEYLHFMSYVWAC